MVESVNGYQKSAKKAGKPSAQLRINGMLALPPLDPDLQEGGEVCGAWAWPEGSVRKIE